MKFSELGLAEAFLKAVADLGYETATPIQAEAIPAVLSGGDLVGCAQTGTGKTAAFTLPTLDRLMQTLPKRQEPVPSDYRGKPERFRRRGKKGSAPKPRALRALVLSPTRELAAQIGESFAKYGRFTPLRHAVVFGGVSQNPQVRALRHGVDALVATPGRLLDLMNQGYVDLSKVEILIFDEADQMLDMGFLPDLKRIVAKVPEQRQTLMFSATMPPEIRELANKWLTDPKSIEVTPVASPAGKITQSIHMIDKKRKPDFLAKYLMETPRSRTLVFSRTKHGADKIVKRLMKDGLKAVAIHGNKSQNARNRALDQFKSSRPPVLVATDIAARGIDVSDVSHVVNFDLPETPETYVHRIGRTGRAGADGVAVSFCSGDERGYLRQIERLTKRSISVEPAVEGFEPTEKVSEPRRPNRRSGGGYKGGGTKGGYKAKSGGKAGYRGGKASASGSKPRGGGSGKPGSKPGKKKPYGAKRPAAGTRNGVKPEGSAEAASNGGENTPKKRKQKQRPGRRQRMAAKAAREQAAATSA